MRIIGLFAICVFGAFSGACTTPPIFPPEIMKDVETNTFDFKAWKDQAHQTSTTNMPPHKVELGARILNVIRNPQGIIILAEEQAIEKYAGYCPKCVKRDYPSTFAIVFAGSLDDPGMLEAGNELAVVGTTDRPSPELIAGTAKMLPHLNAHCLHIWKTEEAKMPAFFWEGAMGYVPPEHGIFCRDDSQRKSSSSGGGQGDEKEGSAES